MAAGEFLRSSVGGKTTLIALGDVICLLAEDKYTTVFHLKGNTVINESLVELEKRFPELLLRIHRNALISPSAIRGLERTRSGPSFVLLEGTDFKPEVSRRKLAVIRKYLREMG
jgi:two-component system response regulator AlgR